MVFKKAIGFWGNKKMFEVTDIRKYNQPCPNFMLHMALYLFCPDFLCLRDIVAGVVVETIVLMAVYSLVIKKKYKSNFDRSIVWDET